MKLELARELVFCLFLLFLCGCEKEPNGTTVHGIVTNKLTHEGLKNIPIKIVECEGWPSKCLNTLQTVYTDATGHYSTSFIPEKRKGYVIAIGSNNIIEGSPYPYYTSILKNKDNVFNFDKLPLKVLQLYFKVQRHNKNWLQVNLSTRDTFDYKFYSLYNGVNPAIDFEKTYIVHVEAGRRYQMHVGLGNYTPPSPLQDYEFEYTDFDVFNVDTTRFQLVVQ